MTLLLPRPTRIAAGTGELVLGADTTLGAPDELTGVRQWFQGALRPATGLALRESTRSTIQLSTSKDLANEGFRLEVTPAGATITGGGPAGVFYGCQAFLQLLPSGQSGR